MMESPKLLEAEDRDLRRKLHDRAAASQVEARKHSMGLATAGLGGVFAVALGDSKPSQYFQLVGLGLVAMAFATSILCGTYAAWADAHWSYHRATRPDGQQNRTPAENDWHGKKSRAQKWTPLSFAIGVSFALLLFLSLLCPKY